MLYSEISEQIKKKILRLPYHYQNFGVGFSHPLVEPKVGDM